MKRTALTGILLALVAIGICACPSRNSEQFDPDKDVTPGGDIPGEDSPNLPPADDAGAWDDYVPASGTAQLSLTLIAPGTCGCSAPAPEEPLLCGWTAGAKASLKAKATVAVDGQPVPGTQVESLELFFVDPATGEETVLDRV